MFSAIINDSITIPNESKTEDHDHGDFRQADASKSASPASGKGSETVSGRGCTADFGIIRSWAG